MAQLRLDGAAYTTICDDLNADTPYDRDGKPWPTRRIRALLLHLRLSGYAVFNRRCHRDGWRANPISEWTSHAPAHPVVFPIEDWAQFMRMDAAARTATDPLDRLCSAAAERGHTLERVRVDEPKIGALAEARQREREAFEATVVRLRYQRVSWPETAAVLGVSQRQARMAWEAATAAGEPHDRGGVAAGAVRAR